jgi:hypothetical protein
MEIMLLHVSIISSGEVNAMNNQLHQQSNKIVET